MKQLMEKDEAGRTLCAVFDSSKTVDSLNKMCDEAQRRIIGHLPATKSKKKRSRPDAIKAAGVQCFEKNQDSCWSQNTEEEELYQPNQPINVTILDKT